MICRIYHKTTEKKNPLFQGRQSYLMELEGVGVSSATASTGCLPPLMESSSSQTTLLEYQNENAMQGLQNHPFVIPHQENDLKRLMISPGVSQPHLFPMNGFQPDSSSPTTNKNSNINSNPLPSSMLFKSLLSHQDCTLKERAAAGASSTSSSTIPKQKQCKTECNFSLHDGSLQLLMDKNDQPNPYHDRDHDHQCQDPLALFDMDYSALLAAGGVGGVGGFTFSSSSAPPTAAAPDAAALAHMSTSLPFNFQPLLHIPPTKLLPEDSWPLHP